MPQFMIIHENPFDLGEDREPTWKWECTLPSTAIAYEYTKKRLAQSVLPGPFTLLIQTPGSDWVPIAMYKKKPVEVSEKRLRPDY